MTGVILSVAMALVLGSLEPASAVDEWSVRGRVSVRACTAGRCGNTRDRFEGVRLLLDVDPTCLTNPPRIVTVCGAYRLVRGGPGCRQGTVTPDEVGIVVARRRRLVFEPTNLDELVAALRACVPDGSFELHSYQHTFRPRRLGNRATGGATLRFTLTLRDRVLLIRSHAGYRATPLE